ncbi:unnamed protein product [Gadus morhua 'NCC']
MLQEEMHSLANENDCLCKPTSSPFIVTPAASIVTPAPSMHAGPEPERSSIPRREAGITAFWGSHGPLKNPGPLAGVPGGDAAIGCCFHWGAIVHGASGDGFCPEVAAR